MWFQCFHFDLDWYIMKSKNKNNEKIKQILKILTFTFINKINSKWIANVDIPAVKDFTCIKGSMLTISFPMWMMNVLKK